MADRVSAASGESTGLRGGCAASLCIDSAVTQPESRADRAVRRGTDTGDGLAIAHDVRRGSGPAFSVTSLADVAQRLQRWTSGPRRFVTRGRPSSRSATSPGQSMFIPCASRSSVCSSALPTIGVRSISVRRCASWGSTTRPPSPSRRGQRRSKISSPHAPGCTCRSMTAGRWDARRGARIRPALFGATTTGISTSWDISTNASPAAACSSHSNTSWPAHWA